VAWNPNQYLKFSGHRLRPALDLLLRIPDFPARTVADLGAGAGNVTSAQGTLAGRRRHRGRRLRRDGCGRQEGGT